jgi:hypothetical protein
MVVIAVVAPLGGTFMDTSALITCTRNFPSERGTVIGIVKACIGASPAGRHHHHYYIPSSHEKARRLSAVQFPRIMQTRAMLRMRVVSRSGRRAWMTACSTHCYPHAAVDVDLALQPKQAHAGRQENLTLISCYCAGLSASVFTSIYMAFFEGSAVSFLLFLAVAPTSMVLVTACFMNHVPFRQATESHEDTGGRTIAHYHCYHHAN